MGVALITGANRGLGFETARQIGRAGLTVLVGARDVDAGDRAAERMRADGIDAEAVGLDVTSTASVAEAAALVEARHGRLDVLVNNAGILPEAFVADRPDGLGLDLFTTTFDVNVFGVVRVVDAFLPLLRRAPSAVVVNVSSTMGSLTAQGDPGSPYYGLVVPAYQTSKAALNGITVSLAKLLAGDGIAVTSVCPGWVQTDLGGPENRAAAPLRAAEAAEVVVAAALGGGGGTGGFVDRDGAVAW